MLSESKSGWRYPGTKSKTQKNASEEKNRCLKSKKSSKHTKSPHANVESILHDKIKQHRAKGRKVSENYIRITAKSIIKESFPEMEEQFKGSKGWFHRFLRRKNIKSRKRKSGKKTTGEDNLENIIKVSQVIMS